MATVYIPEDRTSLAERLARDSVGRASKRIFGNFMHLMVFASLVGRAEGRSLSQESRKRGPEIYDHIFENGHMDGVAFLLALQKEKDGEILRDKNDGTCWQVLEDYAAGGFEIIEDWLIDNPGDTDGVETILNHMKMKAAELRSSGQSVPSTDDVEIEF